MSDNWPPRPDAAPHRLRVGDQVRVTFEGAVARLRDDGTLQVNNADVAATAGFGTYAARVTIDQCEPLNRPRHDRVGAVRSIPADEAELLRTPMHRHFVKIEPDAWRNLGSGAVISNHGVAGYPVTGFIALPAEDSDDNEEDW